MTISKDQRKQHGFLTKGVLATPRGVGVLQPGLFGLLGTCRSPSHEIQPGGPHATQRAL